MEHSFQPRPAPQQKSKLDLSLTNTRRLFEAIRTAEDSFSHTCIDQRLAVGIGGLECEQKGGIFRLLFELTQIHPKADIALLQFTRDGKEQTVFHFVRNQQVFDAVAHAIMSDGISFTTNFHTTSPDQGLTLARAVACIHEDPHAPHPVCIISFDGAITGATLGKVLDNLARLPAIIDLSEQGLLPESFGAAILKKFAPKAP